MGSHTGKDPTVSVNAYTFDLGEEVFVASACPHQPQGSGWIRDFRQRLCEAGVEALRCAPSPILLTSYPTCLQEIYELRAVHAAVRTGNFGKLTLYTPDIVLFGLLLPKPVHHWLLSRRPGQPMDDIVRHLTWLAQGDPTMLDLFEAQLEYSVIDRVIADVDHKLITDESIPDVLRDSHDTDFNLPIGCVFITHGDWRRVVENGGLVTMKRGESRKDVWRCWFQASAAHKMTRAPAPRLRR